MSDTHTGLPSNVSGRLKMRRWCRLANVFKPFCQVIVGASSSSRRIDMGSLFIAALGRDRPERLEPRHLRQFRALAPTPLAVNAFAIASSVPDEHEVRHVRRLRGIVGDRLERLRVDELVQLLLVHRLQVRLRRRVGPVEGRRTR